MSVLGKLISGIKDGVNLVFKELPSNVKWENIGFAMSIFFSILIYIASIIAVIYLTYYLCRKLKKLIKKCQNHTSK